IQKSWPDSSTRRVSAQSVATTLASLNLASRVVLRAFKGAFLPLRTWSSDRLAHTEEVAFAVAEPGAPFTPALRRVVAVAVRDPMHRPHAGSVDRFEVDAARLEVGDNSIDVVHLPRHLRGFARRLARRLEHDEVGLAALVPQSAGTFFDGIESELLRIPTAGA